MTRNKKNWDYLVDYAGQYQGVLGTGAKGQQGVKGQKGEAGVDGADGRDGADGAPGVPSSDVFTFQGSETDFNSLPLTGNSKGDVRQTLDNNNLYVWDGGAWNLLSSSGAAVVKGDKGEKGEKLEFSDLTPAEVLSLKGEKGEFEKGEKGEKGELPLISSLPVLP